MRTWPRADSTNPMVILNIKSILTEPGDDPVITWPEK